MFTIDTIKIKANLMRVEQHKNYRTGKFHKSYIVFIETKDDNTTEFGYLTKTFSNKSEAVRYAKTTTSRPMDDHELFLKSLGRL